MDLHDHGNHNSPSHKLFATKYCFLIPGDDTSFFFFISFSFGFLLFYVIINFYKNYFIIIILFIYFHENYCYFFMFRDVPECSMFLVLSTPLQLTTGIQPCIDHTYRDIIFQLSYFVKCKRTLPELNPINHIQV